MKTAGRDAAKATGRNPRRIDALPAGAHEENQRLKQSLATVDAEIAKAKKSEHSSSVDSEIALVEAGDYPLSGWVPNPFFPGNQNKELAIDKSRVLMVSRLDGPSEKSVRRMIDDALAAEKLGLSGIAYFDARWPEPAAAPKGGYEFYDASIHRAARIVSASGRMPVKLDAARGFFQPGEAQNAALYCGWYSLGQYVECLYLEEGGCRLPYRQQRVRDAEAEGSQVWCKRMLEEGAAAVIGPVDEPYVQAFPVPEIFRAAGLRLPDLAECYAASTSYLSWRMVLIGDPLYRLFANTGRKPG